MQAGGLGAVLDAAGVFFVPVCEDLGFTRSEISLYLTFYFIATVFAMPVVGKWITKFNVNRLLSVSFALVVAAVAAMGLYTQPWQWWVSGVVFGLAGSFIFVVPAPILIDNWFKKHKGLALGCAMSFSGIGGAVLSPVFTLLIETFGWREAYMLAAVVMAVLVLPWTLFVFKLHPEDIGWKPYGWTEEDERREKLRVAEHRDLPGVPVSKALKTVPFVCMFLFAGLIAYFAGFNSHLPGFAQSVGFSAMVGSSLLTAVMVGNVVEKFIVGWLNDKIGVQRTTLVELVLIAVGIVGFIVFHHPALLIVSAVLFGVQDSLMSVSLPLLIRDVFGSRNYTQIHAWIRTGVGLFGSFSGVLVGSVYDQTGTFVPAFAVLVVTCFAAIGCVVVAYRWREHRKLVWRTEDGEVCERPEVSAGGRL